MVGLILPFVRIGTDRFAKNLEIGLTARCAVCGSDL